MNETYVECLVKRKTPTYMKLLKVLAIMLAVCFLLVGFLFMHPVSLIIGVILGVAAYFITMNADLEYEYLYMDKELSIDKIMAKSRRKKIGKFDLERMEIIAPIKSHQLDSYKNRKCKVEDYSTGEEKQPDRRFAIYYDGGKKLIIEPDQGMLKAMKTVAPRKVFLD